MKRFVNSGVSTYHHGVISDFSDKNSFISGGVARGYNVKEYSWISDFLYKNSGNLSLNPHICYLDFVSDKDIMYQEYGNVSKIKDYYHFFEELDRNILSDHSRELSTNQYIKLGQRGSEYIDVRYINPSEKIISLVDENPGNPGYDIYGRVVLDSYDYDLFHEFYRAPIFHTQGYKINLDDAPGALEYKNFNSYIFANNPSTNDTISEYGFTLGIDEIESDMTGSTQTLYDILASGVEDRERLVDYKLFIDNPVYSYFEELSREWVMYYNDSVHYQGSKFAPYYGLVKFYVDSEVDSYYWESIDPMFQFDDEGEAVYNSEVLYFPEVIYNNKLEPAKIIVDWGQDYSGDVSKKGRGVFNPCNHLNEPDDQSRIVYNISGNLINWDSVLELYTIKKWDDDSYSIFGGIDVDTERNRRYSAVVMTEPYMTTQPIGNGTIVEYEFIDQEGKKTSDWGATSEPMFLRIRGPLSIFTEIDEELLNPDLNTDIINTVTIENITEGTSYLSYSSEYYENFRGVSYEGFLERQDDCLDDLVHNVVDSKSIVGTGHHKEFYIDPQGDQIDSYSGSGMKVVGAGYESTTTIDPITKKINGYRNILNIYTTNYASNNCPDPDENPIPNDQEPFLYTTLSYLLTYNKAKVRGSEVFKPMIKLQTMNGYVKIMRRNPGFKVTRSSDGMYEIVYDVEFPYCPGSYSARVNITSDYGADYDNRTMSGFIYKKAGYINAGSNAVDDLGRYENTNDRYAPYDDDSFTTNKILMQYEGEDNVDTDPFSRGGGIQNILSPERKLVSYPPDLVWSERPKQPLIQLIKPNYTDYRRYGTYEIQLDNVHEGDSLSRDMKLVCYSDNRQWKFDKDKFSSYINRENPSFVCEMDIETLFKNFTDFQKLHGSIPDVKRWLYGYFSGFGFMLSNPEFIDGTENITTMGNNNDLYTEDSESDFMIELWDSKYREETIDGETFYYGNWVSFMSNGYDYSKIPGSLIVSDLYISNLAGADPFVPTLEIVDGDISIYSMDIGSLVINDDGVIKLTFPKDIRDSTTSPSIDVLNGRSNLVFYDKVNKLSYHVSYIVAITNDLYRIYFEWDQVNDPPFSAIQISDIDENTTADYELREAFKIMGKSPSSSETIKAVDSIDTGFLTNNIDIKSNNPTDGVYTDFERYVVNDKINLRIRIARRKDFPQSFADKDTSYMLYSGADQFENESEIDSWNNFPWYDKLTSSFDTGFDWAKITLKETVRKIGLNYFKCSSK